MDCSDYPNSDTKKIQWLDLSIDFHEFQFFCRNQGGTYQISSYGELRVLISRWNIIKSMFWNIGRSVFQNKEQNWQNFWRKRFYNKKRLVEALMEKMKPVVMDDKWGWVWRSRIIFDKKFYFETSDYQDSAATNKINGFATQHTSTIVLFSIGFLMEKFELVVAAENKFEYWAKKMKASHFRNFRLSRFWSIKAMIF